MTEFKPGDTVEYIDDKTTGKVVSLIDKQKVLIEIEDGLEIPVFKHELINLSTENKSGEIVISLGNSPIDSMKKNLKPSGIYLAFSSAPNDHYAKISLINEFGNTLYYTFFSQTTQETNALSSGELKSFEYCLLTNIDIQKHDKLPTYFIQILQFSENMNEIPQPITFQFHPKGKMLLEQNKLLPLINSKGYLVKIFPEEKKMDISASKIQENKKEEINIEKPNEIIDLHIENICQDHRRMSREEMFDFQVKYFENSLEKAIALNFNKIIFIHGIGVNTLKNSIVNSLKHNPNVRSFRNADVREFGYGATEVFFK